MLTIAVIDDGVSRETIPHLSFELVYKNGIIQEESEKISHFSHGSFCAAIIKKYAPEADFGSIRVLDWEQTGNLDALIAALKWCANQKIKLINLSIGSSQACDIPALYEAVNEVVDGGGIIVAACKNLRNASFPASFGNVIGVRADESLAGMQYIINPNPNGGIEFCASASHEIYLTADTAPFAINTYNSYSAPVMSAILYNLLSTQGCGSSIDEIKAELYKQAGCLKYDAKFYLDTPSFFDGVSFVEKVPAVIFVGENGYDIMRVIAGKLLNDNYFPLLLSSSEDDCSLECFYIGSDSKIDDKIYAMAEFYGANLILAVIRQDEIKIIESKEDFVIVSSDEDVDVKHFFGNLFYTKGSNIDEVYVNLMDILEE